MADAILKKISNVEKILNEINSKIDNFLGFEELSPEEKKELEEIRKEIKRGEYVKAEEIFSD
ncbi:MAG: hypothetical protein U9O96_01850 [Candidatus Thermoplasmatota archaeon]|nr:hypothetical protein [Candidatus Thermoplasmatota archaeon]